MKKELQQAKKEIKKITRKFPEIIKFAYIYGSSLTKKDPNDIDTLLIIDSEKVNNSILFSINKEIKTISEKNKKIHIQAPREISSWWKLILKGEPWIIDSLTNSLIIKDTKNILKEISEIVSKESTFKKEEIIEDLLERIEKYFIENKNLLLNQLSEISEAATEAMQIFLIFNDKIILNKERIVEEIEKNYSKKINPMIIDYYKEIIDLEQKSLNNILTEVSAENIEHYKEKAETIVDYLEKAILK